ncbi:MAG: hypothetical protein ACT6RI_12575 [Aeromicrobium sp.]
MQTFIPDLGLVVGQNVASYRRELGWSQLDLVQRLNETGQSWSSSSLSLLETRGSRGERISDLAALCAVLDVSLASLLHGPSEVETQSGSVVALEWVVASLGLPKE